MKNLFIRRCFVIALTLCALCSSGCQRRADEHISGEVSIGSATTLPGNATLELQLSDISGDDGSVVIAQQSMAVKALPTHYELPFERSRINDQHRYMMEARLKVAGQLRYATDQPFEVFTTEHRYQRDLLLAPAGASAALAQSSAAHAADKELRGEWRTATQVSLYRAGFVNQSLTWLEEDRSDTTGVIHARYEYKGGYLLRYADTKAVELRFDDHGKPQSATRQGQPLDTQQQSALINDARQRASLLRSHALALADTREHRALTHSDE